jgi:hypothetical protein
MFLTILIIAFTSNVLVLIKGCNGAVKKIVLIISDLMKGRQRGLLKLDNIGPLLLMSGVLVICVKLVTQASLAQDKF